MKEAVNKIENDELYKEIRDNLIKAPGMSEQMLSKNMDTIPHIQPNSFILYTMQDHAYVHVPLDSSTVKKLCKNRVFDNTTISSSLSLYLMEWWYPSDYKKYGAI